MANIVTKAAAEMQKDIRIDLDKRISALEKETNVKSGENITSKESLDKGGK